MIWLIIMYLSIGAIFAVVSYETIRGNIQRKAFSFGERVGISYFGMTKRQKLKMNKILLINLAFLTLFYPVIFAALFLRKKKRKAN